MRAGSDTWNIQSFEKLEGGESSGGNGIALTPSARKTHSVLRRAPTLADRNKETRRAAVLRKFVFLALMAGCAFSVFPMTLEEAVRTTLSTNPDIAVSRQSAEAQGYLARQSKAGIYPSIEIGLAGGWEQSNNTTTRATGVESLDLSRTERVFDLPNDCLTGTTRGS